MALLLALTGLTVRLGSLLEPGQLRDWLEPLGPWAPLGYMALFTLLPVFFFPVALLALAGGLLFGLWDGVLYTLIGAMLNCSLMFLLARTWGRERLRRYLAQKLSPKWQAIFAGAAGQKGFFLLVLLRLIPAVPYNLINYGFGLTDMGLGPYLAASAIGILPGTFVFINLGDKALDPGSPAFWQATGLLLALLLLTALLGKYCFKKENHP